MKKIFFMLFLSLFLCVISPQEVKATEENNNYIVLAEDDKSLTTILAFLESNGITYKTFDLIHGFSADLSEETVVLLKENPSILSIEENKKVSVEGELVKSAVIKSTASNEITDWGMKSIKADKAWDRSLTGKGVRVAVLDTGILTSHPDLKVAGGKSFTPYTSSYIDDNGHGTHVAGIISAQHNNIGFKGVAPGVEIYGLKVLDKKGEGELDDILAAIEWCIQNKMDIINMSLSFDGESIALNAYISKAAKKNILLVAATGNNGGPVMSPAKNNDTIAVTSIDNKNTLSTFSSKGKEVDLTAPGEMIASTYIKNGYAYMSGTSMAAPHVTGIFALYKEAYPNLSNQELKNLVYKNALDLGNKGIDTYYGNGLVQAPVTNVVSLPEAPTGLHANPLNGIIELSWNTVNSNVAGYNIYVNGSKHNKSLLYTNQYTVSGLTNNTTYTIQVSYVNTNGVESKKSANIYATPRFTANNNPGNFSDVPSNYWAKSSIAFVNEKKWMNGTSPYKFNPEGYVTRAQAAAILVRALELQPLYLPLGSSFKDVPSNHWAYQDIEIAAQHGLFNGNEDGSFDPNGYIKREHMAAVLTRAFFKNTEVNSNVSPFSDVSKNRSTYRAIAIMKQENIFGGYQDGTFKPAASTTRAQMASIMQRIDTKIN